MDNDACGHDFCDILTRPKTGGLGWDMKAGHKHTKGALNILPYGLLCFSKGLLHLVPILLDSLNKDGPVWVDAICQKVWQSLLPMADFVGKGRSELSFHYSLYFTRVLHYVNVV